METLADALPKEIARVRGVLKLYHELGPVGIIGAALIERDLQKADTAIISGDVVAMLRSFQALKEIEA